MLRSWKHSGFNIHRSQRVAPGNREDMERLAQYIIRNLGLWEAGVRIETARDPPEPDEPILEPWLDDPFPDYDHEPVFAQN